MVLCSAAHGNFYMQMMMGWAGLLCVSALLLKALTAQHLLFYSLLALVVSVMWLLMYQQMAPVAKVAVLSQSVVFGAQLILSAILFVATQYFGLQAALRVSLFILSNLAFLLVFLWYCQQQNNNAGC